MNDIPAWRLFWAKTDKNNPNSAWTRPLWAHLLDVAHTALLLWQFFLPHELKQRIARDLGLSPEETGYVLSFWIGLHDIGKAIPTFQALHPPSREKLEAAGFRFEGFNERKHHGHASIAILAGWLSHRKGSPFFEQVAAWVGAHHGRLYARQYWENDLSNPGILGDQNWKAARHALLDALHKVWFARHPVQASVAPPGHLMPTWLPAFGGWATLADWLGSMASFFPRDTGTDLMAYLEKSRRGAEQALRSAGFERQAHLHYPGFEALFPFAPNPMQEALVQMPLPEKGAPSLVLVEGPTGEGKTEGAFALTARLQEHTRGSGLYTAMPTQATSDGLFERTLNFLQKAHTGTANFRLVHGNADLSPDQENLIGEVEDLDALFDQDDQNGPERTEGMVRTLTWFLPRKRSLLAPYGLGTVDQAFLGVLYARHFFLRLFALSGKTVLFDEVHAYDLYMQHLFVRLLRWLHALGCHVILLSATLPARFREACFKAWGDAAPENDISPASVPYPAIWQVQNGKATLYRGGFPTRWMQKARLIRFTPDPEEVARKAVAAYEQGAVVLVICNTVRRAQAIFQALPEEVRAQTKDVMLLHARYRFGQRKAQQDRVLERFGKKRPSGRGAILVATQLAEQSLDLDADVLFTDLAPIDLLLQRAGRLHRHLELRPSEERPEGYRVPMVYWLCPEADPGCLPDLSDIGIRVSRYTVYAPAIAWKTWAVLKDLDEWHLPVDYRTLIEAVYADDQQAPEGLSDEGLKQWEQAIQTVGKMEKEAKNEAFRQLIPEPTRRGLRKLLDPDRRTLADEDDDEAHPSQRVLTRLGAESAEVVVLFTGTSGNLYLDPACTEPAPLSVPTGRKDLPVESVRALLQNGVRISYEDIAQALRERDETELPEPWRQAAAHTPALQHRHPLVLTEGKADVAGYRITEDAELGICIERVKK
ncbi:MAG: CRISPR-associated helicase Cas3' [Caldilineae bacterium]|nr:MAG: CRISPR-associated helicase Cas3' [Caldilineae bacterium]